MLGDFQMEFKTIYTTDSDEGKEALAKTVVQYLFDLGETHSNIQVENFNFHDENDNETISFDSYDDIVDFIYDNPNPTGYFYNSLNGEQINIHPYFEGKMLLSWAIDFMMNFSVTLVNNLAEE